MNKMPFDPKDLEPKNGDFAKYIDGLNQKSIKELKALQVQDAQIDAAKQASFGKPLDTTDNAFGHQPLMTAPLPQAPAKKKRNVQLMPFAVMASFAIIFLGMITEDEPLILSGFGLSFFVIVFGGILQGMRKKK